jgi:hypothetical protein
MQFVSDRDYKVCAIWLAIPIAATALFMKVKVSVIVQRKLSMTDALIMFSFENC